MSGNSRLSRALTVTGLTLAAIASTAVLASTADAAPSPVAVAPTTLSFTPAKGLDTTPMFLVTPKPCPAAATQVSAIAVGHGFPADGQPVVGTTTAGISHTAPFVLPLQDSFTGLAAVNGAALSGSYRITLRCTDDIGVKTYAAFTATVTFSDAHHFTAPATPPSVVAAIVASQNPNQDASPAPSSAATASAGAVPSASAGTVSPQGSAAAGAAGGPTASRSLSAAAARHSSTSSSSWQPWLVVGALLLIVGAVLMRARELRQGRRRDAAKAAAKPAAESSPDLTSADR
jgi:hypothetical protein